MGAVPGQGPKGGGGSGPKLTWLGTLSDNSAASSYAFGNIVVPRAGLLVVGISSTRTGSGTRQTNTIGIGGVNVAPQIRNGSAQNGTSAMRAIAVSAGSIAIAAAFSGSMQSAIAGCWLLEEYQSATPADSNVSGYGSTVAEHTVTMDYTDPSVGLFCDMSTSSSLYTSVTPTGGVLDGDVALSLNHGYFGHYSSAGGELAVASSFLPTNGGNGIACGLVFK